MENLKRQIKKRFIEFLNDLKEVCSNCGREPEDVQVVYAAKYLNPEQFVAFLEVAKETNIVPIIIGENRVQEAEEKLEYVRQEAFELLQEFSMIMIGTLQKNKINKAIKIFSEIHAIDSLDLADELNRRLKRENRVMPVFLEVNVSGEESKHGFRGEEMDRVIREIREMRAIKIEGVMTMAPYTQNPEEIRGVFRKLKELADIYKLQTSMGMSNDWKVAIEEGTDMIRIGGRIFG